MAPHHQPPAIDRLDLLIRTLLATEVAELEKELGIMNSAVAKKGLGKGLSALMSDATPMAAVEMATTPVNTLPVTALQAGQFQPRRQFDDEVLHELADSIEKNGIMQPIVVRAIGEGRYEIIAGERRFRAAKLAKLTDVPVIIREVDDAQALELALIENIQRADLNPLEEAAGYQRLMDEFRYTQEKLAAVVGKSRSHVANLLRLLDLPESIKKLVDAGKLSMGHARALIGARHPELLAGRIVEEGLNVRQAEALANGENPSRPKAKKGPIKAEAAEAMKSDEVKEIESMLADNLGLKVTLTTRSAKAGEVVVHYETLAELDEVLRRLGA